MQFIPAFRLVLLGVLLGIGVSGCAEDNSKAIPEGAGTTNTGSDTFFSVTGDVTVSIEAATASLTRIRGSIPAMTIVSAPAAIKKLGSSYSVNLFFSNDFEPGPGVFPIAYSYRKQVNTLGGSFLKRGDMFSHDTKGVAEFIEFGDQVRVRFEFESFNESVGHEARQRVTVKGEAVCASADIF